MLLLSLNRKAAVQRVLNLISVSLLESVLSFIHFFTIINVVPIKTVGLITRNIFPSRVDAKAEHLEGNQLSLTTSKEKKFTMRFLCFSSYRARKSHFFSESKSLGG
jgi:hypothetical protein